uniref:Uncharacterized protein n=1 Tax=Nelumbo nucifera TaxID=4432 RepID=A0A822Y658_NELNU|nr:TPA_asm: hypothetical protein HUJ06_028579 [Nelumbo nucifera]
MVEVPDHMEVENEKPKHSVRKAPSSMPPEVSDQCMSKSSEKTKKDTMVPESKKLDVETSPKPLTPDAPTSVLNNDHPVVELELLQSNRKDENVHLTNEHLISKEEPASNKNRETSRRASFLAKQDYPENGLKNSNN